LFYAHCYVESVCGMVGMHVNMVMNVFVKICFDLSGSKF